MKKALLLSAIIATAQAQVFEMDQGFDSGASGGNAVLDVQHLGQTFTVGIEGTLHQVQLNLFYVSDPGGSGIMDDLTFWLYRPKRRAGLHPTDTSGGYSARDGQLRYGDRRTPHPARPTTWVTMGVAP